MNYDEKEKLLREYETYLDKNQKRLNTARSHTNSVHLFLNWCDTVSIDYKLISYTDLLSYVDYMKNKGNKHGTILCKIQGLKYFYNDLQQREIVDYNPCDELRIKGRIKRVPSNLMTWEELEAIYTHYPTANLTGKRNKIMVGLMVYQGLTSGEIERLTVHDVDLERGKIYVQGILRSNSRVLKLDTAQILQLQKYITQIREIIYTITDKTGDQLFTTVGSGDRFSNCLATLLKTIKAINPKAKSVNQIRASVLTYWLTKYNVREVQYMSGHRYVSSTERYSTTRLEGLQEMIDELHPLK